MRSPGAAAGRARRPAAARSRGRRGRPRPEGRERSEEPVVLAAQVARPGHVHPVGGPAGAGDRVVRHPDEYAHVPRLVHRPLGERAVAQVVPDEHLIRNEPGQPVDCFGEAVPRACGGPRQDALDVEGLVGDVPLDRQVLRRDGCHQAFDLPRHQLLVAAHGDRVVGLEVGAQPVQRAHRERQPHLEPEVSRDNTRCAQLPEDLVGRDRIGYPRPGVPAHLADAGPDPEDRRLVHVPRYPGGRGGLRDRLDRGVGPDQASRSYPTQDERGPVSPSGNANTRSAKFAAPARSAAAVDVAGTLPTRSRSLVTRGDIGVSSVFS